MNEPVMMPRRKAILGMGATVAVAATESDFATETAPQNESIMHQISETSF